VRPGVTSHAVLSPCTRSTTRQQRERHRYRREHAHKRDEEMWKASAPQLRATQKCKGSTMPHACAEVVDVAMYPICDTELLTAAIVVMGCSDWVELLAP
jgi:hypothetical protein